MSEIGHNELATYLIFLMESIHEIIIKKGNKVSFYNIS